MSEFKLGLIQQGILEAQNASHILGCNQKRMARRSRGDSSPLLCPYETPPEALCPALGPPAQERCGSIVVGPKEGDKDDKRDGTPLLCGQAETVGLLQPN